MELGDVENLVARAADARADPADRLAAFGQIVLRCQDMAYGCAYAILGNFHLAEDAAQDAFVIAFRRLHELRERGAFPGWLRRIVVSQCRRLTRGKNAERASLARAEAVPAGAEGPAEALEKQEMKARVLAAIRQLPEHQRMVTALFYINGYSTKDIAAFLDVPVTTVKKRLADSRKRLKQRMMDMVDETLKSFSLRGGFADVVVRKAASQAELDAAGRFMGHSRRVRPKDFGSLAGAEEAGIYVVGDSGDIQGAGYFTETRLAIGSTIVRAVRPREMGGEAEGVPDPRFVQSFRACFKLARERGIHVAAVHGSQWDHAFCGFVPCFYYPVATLACEAARAIVTRATLAPAGEREAEAAAEACLRDPYAPKMSAYLGGGQVHVVRQGGQVVGYARLNADFRPAEKYGMPFGFVTDVTVQTREAALAVIRAGAELAVRAGEETLCLMQTHRTRMTQAMLSLGGTYRLRGPCDRVGLDAEMVAIIDLAGLTEQLAGEFRDRAAACGMQGPAAFSMEMDGQTVGFEVDKGRLGISTGAKAVHRRLPRWVLTRLYMGYHSGADVLEMGPIPWDRSDGKTPDDVELDNEPLLLPEQEAAMLKALFPKLWPCAWPDPDVWPWVLGQPGPKYQAEQRKTAEMKAAIDALRFAWLGR